MRRRELMGTGMGLLATPIISTTRAQQPDFEQVVSDTYDVPGLATSLSSSGDTVLFGFDDGTAIVYDDDRDGASISLGVDRSVSHIAVRDETTTAVLGWIDANVFGLLDLATGDGPLVEQPGLWDIATTPDAGLTAAVTTPSATSGSVSVTDRDGTILWETPFGDAAGQSVAISDDGTHIAVGASHYWNGRDSTGQPGIRLYDGTGTELWRHDHGDDVLAVDVDAERELVVAGIDDGHTIVLDFEGTVVWETDAYGGSMVLSDDGGTILTVGANETLYALESTTGDAQWTADIGMWPADDLSVSADGSRVFVADRSAAEFVVVDEGETIWTEAHDVGPGRGALAADGSTWSTIVTNLDDETARVAVYRATAVAEPEPAPGADASTTEDDDPSDEDPPEDEDGSSDDEDPPDAGGDPTALELVDYSILGEMASEEYITLRNTGEGPLDMSGWTIEDDHRIPANNASPFPFPSGFTLDAGADVTISTGEGEPTADTLYWGYSGDFQIWNEEGDVVYVLDASGNVVLEQPIAAEPEPGPPDDSDDPGDGSDDPDDPGDGSDDPDDPDDPDGPDDPDDPNGPNDPDDGSDDPDDPDDGADDPDDPDDGSDDSDDGADDPDDPGDGADDPDDGADDPPDDDDTTDPATDSDDNDGDAATGTGEE